MKFDKDSIAKLEKITLVLENCETFDVPAGDVLDLRTSELRAGAYGQNSIDDGSITISKRALRNLSGEAQSTPFAELGGGWGEPKRLADRIMHFCDVCRLEFKFKDGKSMSVMVPYDPLVSNLSGCEVDLSNCPSAELDKNGDMVILFGQSSHAYRRTDNNYHELVVGLKDHIKSTIKRPLRIALKWYSNNELDFRCPRIFADMELIAMGRAGKTLRLVFEDVQNVSYDIDFDSDNKKHLWMSRISTGEIFVEIENFCTFYCNAVKTYDEFVGVQPDYERFEDGGYLEKALNCTLDDGEMELFASGNFAFAEDGFNLKLFTSAVKKVLKGEISIKYYRNWLKVYLAALVDLGDEDDEEYFKCCQIAAMLDRLQIKLTYYDSIDGCRGLIEASAKEIDDFYKHFPAD